MSHSIALHLSRKVNAGMSRVWPPGVASEAEVILLLPTTG